MPGGRMGGWLCVSKERPAQQRRVTLVDATPLLTAKPTMQTPGRRSGYGSRGGRGCTPTLGPDGAYDLSCSLAIVGIAASALALHTHSCRGAGPLSRLNSTRKPPNGLGGPASRPPMGGGPRAGVTGPGRDSRAGPGGPVGKPRGRKRSTHSPRLKGHAWEGFKEAGRPERDTTRRCVGSPT